MPVAPVTTTYMPEELAFESGMKRVLRLAGWSTKSGQEPKEQFRRRMVR